MHTPGETQHPHPPAPGPDRQRRWRPGSRRGFGPGPGFGFGPGSGPGSGPGFGPGSGPGPEDGVPGGRRHRHGGFGPGPEDGPGGRRHRRGGFGPVPPVPPVPPFPPGPGGGPGGPGGRGRHRGRGARRGDVRAAVLALLTERPMHGYEIIQTIEERSGGVWRPSPGSIYPTLQLLADEGLVTADETGGRRLFTLTDAGRDEAGRRSGGSPFTQERDETFEVAHRFRDELHQLGLAVWQVAQVGTDAQRTEILAVLAAARRRAYQLLADGGPSSPTTHPDPAE